MIYTTSSVIPRHAIKVLDANALNTEDIEDPGSSTTQTMEDMERNTPRESLSRDPCISTT